MEKIRNCFVGCTTRKERDEGSDHICWHRQHNLLFTFCFQHTISNKDIPFSTSETIIRGDCLIRKNAPFSLHALHSSCFFPLPSIHEVIRSDWGNWMMGRGIRASGDDDSDLLLIFRIANHTGRTACSSSNSLKLFHFIISLPAYAIILFL